MIQTIVNPRYVTSIKYRNVIGSPHSFRTLAFHWDSSAFSALRGAQVFAKGLRPMKNSWGSSAP